MAPLFALVVTVSVVALAALLGIVYRLCNGRVRTVRGVVHEIVSPADLPGSPAFGDRFTLLQFSTELCSPCRQAARVLDAAAAEPGIAHIEVDLTRDAELARRFNILRTPTTLVLDSTGAVRGRIGGAPRPAELRDFLDDVLGDARPKSEVAHV